MTTRRQRLATVSIALVGLGVLAVAAAFILTVPPKPAALASSAPSTSRPVGGSSSPDGVWLATEYGTPTAFVGYRVYEKLGLDFITWPNEAVGRTAGASGRLEIRDGVLQAAEINADLRALLSDHSERDGAVAESALETARFPTARFRLTEPVPVTGIDPGKATDVVAHGDLTIKDVTKPVVWPLRARWDGDSIEVAGQVQIDRLEYGVDMGRFLVLRVANDVTLEAQLQFHRDCVGPCSSPGSPPPDLVAASPSPSQQETPAPLIGKFEGVGEIALMGGAGDRSHIYVVNLADGRLRAVTDGETLEFFPFWAANGDRLGYVQLGSFPAPNEGPPPVHLVLADPDGSNGRQINNTERFLTQHPSLSPDGKHIAFMAMDDLAGGDIWVTDLAGKATQLTRDAGAEDEPRWSPDGRLIAYTRFATDSNREDIWVMRSDGTAGHALAAADGYEYNPVWSPDGTRIAYVHDGHIALIDADGSAAVALTDATTDSSPTWSPDGRYLAFIRDRQLLVMRSDGSGLGSVAVDLEQFSALAWRP